jgi:hypothetical protein
MCRAGADDERTRSAASCPGATETGFRTSPGDRSDKPQGSWTNRPRTSRQTCKRRAPTGARHHPTSIPALRTQSSKPRLGTGNDRAPQADNRRDVTARRRRQGHGQTPTAPRKAGIARSAGSDASAGPAWGSGQVGIVTSDTTISGSSSRTGCSVPRVLPGSCATGERMCRRPPGRRPKEHAARAATRSRHLLRYMRWEHVFPPGAPARIHGRSSGATDLPPRSRHRRPPSHGTRSLHLHVSCCATSATSDRRVDAAGGRHLSAPQARVSIGHPGRGPAGPPSGRRAPFSPVRSFESVRPTPTSDESEFASPIRQSVTAPTRIPM